MCGICGKMLFDNGAPAPIGLVQDMATMLAHRGPNDEGFYAKGPVALGHRRLSIIDVSGGGQPISNANDSLWIIFNGEIYNHKEVRADLESKGYRYKTRTDTETILLAYEEYGADCVKRLNGMFAFAIWDERDRSLFIARDRFGIKPLYYRADQHGFAFASEVKALLVDENCDGGLCPEGVFDYFSSFVFGTRTMFQDIHRLAPSHWMRVHDGKIDIERYYWPEIDSAVARVSEADNLEHLSQLFEAVVKDHMMSEVPQGAFLSGGVDSSLITIIMSRLMDDPVRTFSISFEGHKGFDESGYAQQVADAYKTEHHVYNCSPDKVALLPKVLWHLEEPLADAPTIALMMLCQEASKEVTVVHCGDGGDEGYGGYTRFYWDQYANMYNRIPAFMRKGLLTPLYRGLQGLPGEFRNFGRRAEKFTRFSELSPEQRYMTWFSNVPDTVKRQMLTPAFMTQVGGHESVEIFDQLFSEARKLELDHLGTRQYADLYNFVSHSLMLKGDKIAMSAGLEGRFPWLDHRLVDFGLSLPQNQKMSRTQLKIPPRKLLARHMPADFVWRRKQGFGVPIEDWFKGALKESLAEAISDEATRDDGILNGAHLREMAGELHQGNPHVWPFLWCAYVFQQWRKVYSRPREVCREHLRTTTDPFTLARTSRG